MRAGDIVDVLNLSLFCSLLEVLQSITVPSSTWHEDCGNTVASPRSRLEIDADVHDEIRERKEETSPSATIRCGSFTDQVRLLYSFSLLRRITRKGPLAAGHCPLRETA